MSMSNYWVPVLRVAAVSMLMTSLSACATIPSSSPVTPYKPYEAVTTTSAPQGPTPGLPPSSIRRTSMRRPAPL